MLNLGTVAGTLRGSFSRDPQGSVAAPEELSYALRRTTMSFRHLRARLDALYFHLYGLTRDDAAYILSTFPIIQRQDQAAFGHYRTRTLILAYMNALTAGDTVTFVNV